MNTNRCNQDCSQGRSCNCQQQSEPVAYVTNHGIVPLSDDLLVGHQLYLAPPAQSESNLAKENKRLNEKLELLKNTVLELNACEMRNCYEVPIHEYEKLIEIAMVDIFEDSSS